MSFFYLNFTSFPKMSVCSGCKLVCIKCHGKANDSTMATVCGKCNGGTRCLACGNIKKGSTAARLCSKCKSGCQINCCCLCGKKK
ncbi:hypothetical protein TRFO_23339 [Tritrichomonas foetus]|uniref:Uncharacterized protein n=1 Tax=Tritrichomonas foetus TaxID=1144522 RepID=A0A1J4KEM1_9EUKA|nr:hypothetical protein TRFO_23339 [Tritrichomonas foetus]|eukprot:OHT08196.1 hypothetical protein TRFO_23339 [Tritrichomonas foetus]